MINAVASLWYLYECVRHLGKHPPLLLNLCLLKNFFASAFVAKRPRIIRVSFILASTFSNNLLINFPILLPATPCLKVALQLTGARIMPQLFFAASLLINIYQEVLHDQDKQRWFKELKNHWIQWSNSRATWVSYRERRLK